MSAASRSRVARFARDRVLDHAVRTTRGLPEAVARDRFDQVASDVWEQGAHADRHGRSGTGLAGSLLLRSLLGLVPDAGWRRAELVRARSRVSAARVAPAIPLTGLGTFDQTNGAVDFGDAGMRSPNDPLAEIERRSGPAGVVAAGFMGIGM